MTINLGTKLKELRQSLSLTQLEVAESLGLTKGYISQIEKNTTSPNTKIFFNLLDLYGITPSEFFGSKEKEEVVVINKYDEMDMGKDEDLKYEFTNLLNTHSSFDCQILIIEASGRTPTLPKQIGEEFGYILTGKIDLIFDQKRYTLEKGDSFYFPTLEEHHFKNNYTKDVKLIWFKTPKK